MTRKRVVEIDCPSCGHSQATTVWDSINSTINPEDKRALFEGEINQFHCANCNHITFIDKRLLYHDMEKKIAVQYYPSSLLEDDDFLEGFGIGGEIKLPSALRLKIAEYLQRTHIVFDMHELLRYVVFRERLSQKGQSKRG